MVSALLPGGATAFNQTLRLQIFAVSVSSPPPRHSWKGGFQSTVRCWRLFRHLAVALSLTHGCRRVTGAIDRCLGGRRT